MRINVLSLTIKTLSFVKAKQACLSTHDAIERLGEKFQNPETAYEYWKVGHTLQFISLSNYQTRARSEKASQR